MDTEKELTSLDKFLLEVEKVIPIIDKLIPMILSLSMVLGFIILHKWYRRRLGAASTPEEKSRLIQFGVLLYSTYGFVFLLFFNGAVIYYVSDQNFLYDMAVALIVSWVVVLIGYYAWALYFYNINYGWTDDDWNRYEDARANNPVAAEGPPEKNPFAGESLGLPPGTIRGTIALTVLISGLSFVIAALSMSSSVPPNAVVVDNFEFFKKAFLMMIAFYFGTKSLEILQGSGSKTESAETSTSSASSPAAIPVTTPSQVATPRPSLPALPMHTEMPGDESGAVSPENMQSSFHVPGSKG
ncbi:hypothetical protein KK083_07895 [Fulvivirgaceae bacterium PWU4]|uniref:Uncharacterized protein n=1 Tax=Chryseosolibacter histidini TaxID=2782349 RepID=A0AAP2GND6_9BACT|nr:hypothetical protein [Chryseosolibacter histidini]MBT1696790.1 hypothetical protein [Chryseosolibacter histidini]